MIAQAQALTAVQVLNLTILATVRDVAMRDLASACCSFGWSRAQLEALADATPALLVQCVARMGNDALVAHPHQLDRVLAEVRHCDSPGTEGTLADALPVSLSPSH
jgi:hypothetical protein